MMHAPDAPRKLRTLIVDDEPLARTNLLILLRRHAEIEIVGEGPATITPAEVK